jgi:hypothetical protein
VTEVRFMKTSVLSISALWLASLVVGGCGGHETAASRPPSGQSTGATLPEMAPTPYTVEQLRDGNRPGTTYRYRMETAGEPIRIEVMEFMSGTSADMAEVKSETLDESGKAKSPPTVDRSPWEKIRRHAEFPRAALTVEAGSVEVPAGKFDAMVYTVRAPDGETSKFYFAKSYAGPPVLLYTERAGARLMTMTLIERKSGK